MEWSVMTYRSYQNDPMQDGYSNEAGGYAQSLMRVDIAALQQLYGANYDHLSGDTVYAFDPASGEMFIDGEGQGAPVANRIFLTLWDGGGVDTLDASAYDTGVAIDLAPGAGAVLAKEQLAWLNRTDRPDEPIHAERNVFLAELHEGDERALFEDAIGGDGDDVLTGNVADNRLRGGAGADRLFGGAGDDRLLGGTEDDLIDGGAGADRLAGQGGDDALSGGGGGDRLLGGGGADHLSGDRGADRLSGGGGADLLEGGRGADTLIGGGGADTFRFEARSGHDRIVDFASADVLDLQALNTSFKALSLRDVGNDVRIQADGFRLTLDDVSSNDLSVEDFLF